LPKVQLHLPITVYLLSKARQNKNGAFPENYKEKNEYLKYSFAANS